MEWQTLKSMYPFLSISNVRKTWSQNSSALPDGKNILYMSTNLAGVKRPLGQSCCNLKCLLVSAVILIKERWKRYVTLNPLYHSFIVTSSYRVCVFKNSMSSFDRRSLLPKQPISAKKNKKITYLLYVRSYVLYIKYNFALNLILRWLCS